MLVAMCFANNNKKKEKKKCKIRKCFTYWRDERKKMGAVKVFKKDQ